MQERRVTIGNETYVLPVPFVVIATQNPIEQSGTFELPDTDPEPTKIKFAIEGNPLGGHHSQDSNDDDTLYQGDSTLISGGMSNQVLHRWFRQKSLLSLTLNFTAIRFRDAL